MQNRFELPMMISQQMKFLKEKFHQELQDMGFSRSLAYKILQGDILPVVSIGKRRFIRQTVLLEWLAEQEKKCPAGRPPDYVRAETPFSVEDIPDDDQLTFADYHEGYVGGDVI